MDRLGRMPFALIAVLIIIFASFSTIYIATINSQQYMDSEERIENLKDLAEKESEKVRYFGELAVLNALENDVIGSSFLWKISQDAYSNLAGLLEPYAPPDGLTTENGYNIKIFNPIMTVTPIPFEYEDRNPLGMDAKMRSHVYFRTIGSAELLITDLRTDARFNVTVSLDSLIPSTRLFLMEQMLKFQSEVNGDTSVGSEVPGMVEYMLSRKAEIDDGPIVPLDLSTSVNVAILLEEIKFFHDYDEKTARFLENLTGMNFNDYVKNQDIIDPAEIYPGPGYGDGSFTVDVSPYGMPFLFDGSRCGMDATGRTLNVNQKGDTFLYDLNLWENITGFERAFGAQTSYMYLYEFDIETFPRSLTVSVGESLSSEIQDQFTTEVVFDMQIRVLDEYNSEDFAEKKMRILGPEYEDAIKEYVNNEVTKANVELEISTISGVLLEETGGFADIYLDNEFLGSFTLPPILENIQEGAHELKTVLSLPDGSTEFEYSFLNITPEGLLEDSLGNIRDVNISFAGVDSSQFWELMSLVQKDEPFEKKMITAVEWIASVAGYPFPSEVDDMNETEDRTALGDWLGAFSDYLDSIPEVWDPSFSGFLDLAELTVDFAYTTLDMIETVVNEGFNIGELVISLGEDWIEVNIKDPYQKTAAKLVLKFLESKISNYTLTIGDEVLKSKILKNLKNIGDALALITTVISIFRTVDKAIKVISGEEKVQLTEFVDITAEFTQIALKLWGMAVKFISKLGKECLAKLSMRIQKMSAGVVIIFMFISELARNNGDFFKTLESLFLGFDELTISWYTAIISLLAIKYAGILFTGALATGIGALIAVVSIIIMLILNWDELVSWLTHSLSNKQVKELEKSIEGSLEDTIDLTGKLNDMKPEGYAAQAKNYFNVHREMLKRSYFAQHETDSEKYMNLSKYALDFYKANRDIGKSVPRVKCATKLFWFVANDFDGTYYPHGGNTGKATISVNSVNRTNPELNQILNGMTRKKAESAVINYYIDSNPNLDAYEQWQDDLDSISDFLSGSIDEFQGAMSQLKFLNLFPDPSAYSREYGAIIVDYEPYSGLNSLDLSIGSLSGSFRYAYEGLWYEGWTFTETITPDSKGEMRSTVLIAEPGMYSVGILNPNTPVKGASATAIVHRGKCKNVYVETEKDFSFMLNNTFNGHLLVEFYKDGVLSESREFDSPGISSLSVHPGTQAYESVIKWDTDGNVSNGYEVTEYHFWNSDTLSEYGTAYSNGFSLEVRIDDPFAIDNVKDVWT